MRNRAADDPGESYIRAGDGPVFLGELEPPSMLEEFVPFVDGEAPWRLAGADKPTALVALEEERQARAITPSDGGEGSARTLID